MDVLLDLNVGTAIAFIPLLGICQQGPGNLTYNMTYFLEQLFDPSLNFTTYDGELAAPWDQSTASWKFTSTIPLKGTVYEMDQYFEQASQQLKWARLNYNGTDYVLGLQGGLTPATFQDSDFVLTQCPSSADAPLTWDDPSFRLLDWLHDPSATSFE